MIATLAAIAIYAMVAVYFGLSGRRVEATVTRLGLPDWLRAQAEKNRRKAFAYEAWGLPLVMLAAVADTILAREPWSHAITGMSLMFQIGAFAGIYAVIVAQARLTRDLGEWAGGASMLRPASDP